MKHPFRISIYICLVALLLGAEHGGRLELGTGSKDAAVHAILPPATPEREPCQVMIFFGEAGRSDSDYLEKMLAPREKLVALASEMGASFVFVSPRSESLSSIAAAAHFALNALARKYPLDPNRIALISHGAGVNLLIEYFSRHPHGVASLILVSPQLLPEKFLPPSLASVPPALVLFEQKETNSAEATREFILARSPKADVTMLCISSLDKFPAAHVVNFLRYANTAMLLRRVKDAPMASPGFGPGRIESLKALLKLRELLQQEPIVPSELVTLQNAAGPPLESQSEFASMLRSKGELLQPLAVEVRRKIESVLEAARREGAARLDVIKNSDMSPASRKAALERFAEENFPWPELAAAARMEAEKVSASSSPKDSPRDSAKQLPRVNESAFLDVLRRRCVRCHRECADLTWLAQRRWIQPGKPENSPVYTILGKHKNPDGRYHNIPDPEKKIIHDYVKETGK